MLKSFFLSERKLVYAILGVKLKYMKMFISHEIKCYLECRRQISCFRPFCRGCHVTASIQKITSLELLRTLMLCLVQLSKRRESKATDAEKLLS